MSRADEWAKFERHHRAQGEFHLGDGSEPVAAIRCNGEKIWFRFRNAALTKEEAADLGRWLAGLTDDH